MRRPSPALIVAVIALVVACAGSATAAVLISSKDIKDRSIQGKDVRSNTLTGRTVSKLSGRDVIPDGLDGSDIDEDTLDEVPRAAVAGGLEHTRVVRLDYRARAGGGPSTVFDQEGLRIQATCSAAGALDVRATPTASVPAVVRVSVTHPPADTTSTSDAEFTGSDEADLVPGGADGAQGLATHTVPGRSTTTLQYLAQGHFNADRGFDCLFTGTAVVVTP